MYRVRWTERAVRRLDKLDRATAAAIVRFMADRVDGATDPRAIGHALRGERLWRYRAGDYRILCEIQDEAVVVLVIEIGHRREVYR